MPRSFRPVRAVVLGVAIPAAVLLAGCTGAAPPPRLSPAATVDPLDLGAYVHDPCGLLPLPQLARFYVSRPGTVVAGPGCAWTPSDTAALTYSASVGTSGLEDVYRRRAQFPVFEPAVIHGYPAVHVEDGPGHCRLVTCVTGSEVLDVAVDARDGKLAAHDDPCAEVDAFAGAVIGYQGHRAP